MQINPHFSRLELLSDPKNTLYPGSRSVVSGKRYYCPSQGRFIGRDPIEESGALNLYGFVANNPVNKWDVLGMSIWEIIRNFFVDSSGGGGRNNDSFGPAVVMDRFVVNESRFGGGGGSGGDTYLDSLAGGFGNDGGSRGNGDGGGGTSSAPNNKGQDPLTNYPGKTSPGASNPAEDSVLVVDGTGTIRVVTNSQRFISPTRDDAPKGEVEAKMRMSFTPRDGRAATEFAWINWVTEDPLFPEKSVPYQDRNGKAFNDLTFNPNNPNVYNDGVPKFSDGGINFYDRPGNPAGYGVNFSTYLYDKTNATILYRVDWRLTPDGE